MRWTTWRASNICQLLPEGAGRALPPHETTRCDHHGLERELFQRHRRRDAALPGDAGHRPGRALQIDPIKPKFKPLGTKHLKLKRDMLLSTSTFNFNFRRYNMGTGRTTYLNTQKARCHGTGLAGARHPPDMVGRGALRPPPPMRQAVSLSSNHSMVYALKQHGDRERCRPNTAFGILVQ